jgi:tetratricopeptide (TPR) repeat protein
VGEVLSPRPLELTQKLAQVSKARASEDFSVELNGMELILEYEPWRGSQWQRIGRLYLDTHQPGRAVAAFEQAESLGALDAQGFLWLADALLQNGEKQASINVLNGFRTTDSFLLNQAAALLRQADELQQAEEKIRLAYEVDPLAPEINYQLGLMLLAEDPVAARNAFAISQKEEGRSAAARYLSEVIDLYYDQEINADWLITAGKALEQVGEWDVAVKTFRSAVLADPQNALAFALLGFAQQHTGEDGLAALQQALTMDTEGEMPNAMLGIYYHQQGKLEEAFVLLQKAADANPKAAAWRIEMGSVWQSGQVV